MNKLLGVNQTLEWLALLRRSLESHVSGTRAADQESARESARLERQYKHTHQQLEEGRTAGIAGAQAAFETAKAKLDTIIQSREERIARARDSVRSQHLKTSENHEARRVFQIQRDLLRTSRNRDEAIEQADAQLGDFTARWNVAGEGLASLEQRAAAAFRGYPALRRRLCHPADGLPSAEPVPSADQQLAHTETLTREADEALARFGRLVLPRIFSFVPCWAIAGLLVAICAGAVPLSRMIAGPVLTWPQAAGAAVALALLLLGVYSWSRRRATPSADAIIRTIHQAQSSHAASAEAANSLHAHSHSHAQQECAARTSELEQDWNATLESGKQERATLATSIDARSDQAMTRLQRRRAEALARLEAQFHQRLEQLRHETAESLRTLEAETETGRRSIADRRQARRRELDATFKAAAEPAYAALAAAQKAAQDLSPPWMNPTWQDWNPPTSFPSGAPFGQIELDLAAAAGELPPNLLSPLPGPLRLESPLSLTFPHEGSVWFETRERGRESALASLNNLVLRLLAGAPPGRIAFTIIDPVGLGQNFAGLMHLADHADRLINRRIWTQPEQIDQQLADLNEHIEKVTQLYLRNEYQTIAEYNEQAGRVAEPYHFLVIADFPVGFGESALRRLLNIVSSGPRCGVFPLVHWDRRKPVPADFAGDDVRKSAIWLEDRASGFGLVRPAPPGLMVRLDTPPDAATVTALLQRIGQNSVDAYRVELPFAQIAPRPDALWTLDAVNEVRVPVGITGATKLQYLALGKGTCQHALIAGKTGSGKSTLFHVLITNLALWTAPEQIEFYLVDFKKGVEFKCYATHRLPHARVIAIESDREFALSVLERLDLELRRRGDLFRQAEVQDLPGYTRAQGSVRLPRTLLIIDEFQEFFTEDDRVAQNAALILDRLVRQGRAFGIHVLLGSQTLGGAYTLARATLGQMTIRIALQCNQADALLIMDDENTAPRLLSRPGEAIYNDAAGVLEGNHPFQVAWLPDDERDRQLRAVRQHADRLEPHAPPPIVFEGNTPANVRDNAPLAAMLAAPALEPRTPPRIWLGAPNSIKGPTEVPLRRQSGNNLLLIGLYEEAILALLGVSLVSLAGQFRRDAARFVLFDSSPGGSLHRDFIERLAKLIPQTVDLLGPADLNPTLKTWTAELDRRITSGPEPADPAVYLFVHQVPRFKSLRFEDDFSISLDAESASPGPLLNRILSDGPPVGLHALCSCDTYNNAIRCFGRKALTEFEFRVLFQMSPADSASLVDTPKAASLGLHRALLHNAQEGSLETFRPYALPDANWLEHAAGQLSRLTR